MNTSDSTAFERPPSTTPELRASLWLEEVARALYETERVEHPDRSLPSWHSASPVMRADARYRAQGAHMRSRWTVKAVLVEEIARVLALADGYIWPACDNKPIADGGIVAAMRAINVAQRRQLYRHKARLVITAHNKYLDVDAAAQPEEHREAILARAKDQQLADVETVQAWRRSVGQVKPERRPCGCLPPENAKPHAPCGWPGPNPHDKEVGPRPTAAFPADARD